MTLQATARAGEFGDASEICLGNTQEARWYDAEAGVFLSIDPVVANSGDPQSYNAYAYARNNPARYTDPTGMCTPFMMGMVGFPSISTTFWSVTIPAAAAEGVLQLSPVSMWTFSWTTVSFFGGPTGGGFTLGGLGAGSAGGAAASSQANVQPQGPQMSFDGTRLYLTDPSRGVERSWPGVSGMPGSTPEDQDRLWFGPIPEGEYEVDPKKIDHYLFPLDPTDWDWWGAHNRRAWGNTRVPIDRKPGSPKASRKGFFIHGGEEPGSAGCIDLTGAADSFFSVLETYDSPIPLTVGYPKP